jgi:hypothetical protein
MNNEQNELGKAKYFANRGIERHKHPIANLIYKIDVVQLNKDSNVEEYKQYKFKDLGYLTLSWTKHKADKNGEFQWNWHGFITVDDLKERIGINQYAKFCQGKREFIIQRRINGNNISISK